MAERVDEEILPEADGSFLATMGIEVEEECEDGSDDELLQVQDGDEVQVTGTSDNCHVTQCRKKIKA